MIAELQESNTKIEKLSNDFTTLERKLGNKEADLISALASVPILTSELDKAKRLIGRKEEEIS